MCDCLTRPSSALFQPLSTRRQWLQGLSASVAAVSAATSPWALASNPPPSTPRPTPQQALQLLQQGNTRYVAGQAHAKPALTERTQRTRGQWPYAAILSCADSRVPPELVFDAHEGELFVVRLAGNIASTEAIASLEYAVHVLKVPLIMVMGHSQCGAITATVHMLQSGSSLPGHLPNLTQTIAPALAPAAPAPSAALPDVAQATVLNVQHTVRRLHNTSPLLTPALQAQQLHIGGGVFDIASGSVTWL